MMESGGVMCTDDADETSSAMLAKHAYTVDKLVVYVSNKVGALDADSGGRPAGRPRPAGVCGSTAVLLARDGVRRSQRVHVACRQRRSSRFVYVEATSDRGRQRRPFVQPCRVMVYDWYGLIVLRSIRLLVNSCSRHGDWSRVLHFTDLTLIRLGIKRRGELGSLWDFFSDTSTTACELTMLILSLSVTCALILTWLQRFVNYLLTYIQCDLFDCCIFNYEIMLATLANTFIFILQGNALADLGCGGRFLSTLGRS